MFIKKILPGLALVAALLASHATRAEEKATTAKRCTVMAFNVENLFDLDAVSLYDNFPVTGTGAERWTPEKLAAKLSRLAAVLKTSENGRGPDFIKNLEILLSQGLPAAQNLTNRKSPSP